ncbi:MULTISPECIES: class I SAM-dependent methyltransferase [Exiguobacterium]|uniref:class I SAM-dependent methyltransferase n=1 Tax=Exiguobacterium TaxID=33986 RepID=UPI002035BA8B|nr:MULTISPECIES: class I SAM-dependent methyltransferase [Exiguobacterium]MCT4776836.1 class I SAM-dependent methyltransferase [Exiguobacterium aquaticum]MCT4788274.1 class I SAM-dependent methyltransferase [Exiguobacterium mexicanum]
MNNQTQANKTAWEYRAYEFWQKRDGTPADKAKEILKDPRASLKKHRDYFHDVDGLNVANLCGSNGRRAVPLSLMGANVTIFDVSEENRRYALELAACAQTKIDYVLGDIYNLDVIKYDGQFDFLYLEGGILHYFDDLERLCDILYSILKPGGNHDFE